MNLFKKDEKFQTVKNHNDVPTSKAYTEAKPHKDLLNTSKSKSELQSKNAQATQGVKQ